LETSSTEGIPEGVVKHPRIWGSADDKRVHLHWTGSINATRAKSDVQRLLGAAAVLLLQLHPVLGQNLIRPVAFKARKAKDTSSGIVHSEYGHIIAGKKGLSHCKVLQL